MIHRIGLCEKDKSNLEILYKNKDDQKFEQPKNYRDIVVLKPWGYEYLIFENEFVAIWFLHIKKDHSTSMHSHPKKKTSLSVLTGKALCSTFENRNVIDGPGATIIEKGVFHSTKALSEDGIDLIELETPPDKMDLVRLNDAYGREAKGYEGLSDMVKTDLERYRHFFFEEPSLNQSQKVELGSYKLELVSFKNQDGFEKNFKPDVGTFHMSCKNQIFNDSSEVFCDIGDVFEVKDGFPNDLRINSELILLSFIPGR